MSALGLPENRPALARIMELPADWVTPTERLLLLALALDSYDGLTCGPGREGLMRLAGIKYVSTFTRARDALTLPTEYRPALLAADTLKGRHTRYRLLLDVRESQTGDVRESQTPPGELSAEVVRELQTGKESGNLSAEPVRESCPPEMSARVVRESQTYPSLPLPTLREGERKEEARTAPPPDGGALTRLPVAQIRDTITTVVPAMALNGIDCSNTDLADALAQATAAGWTVELMTAALADMPAPKKSATGQAIARLRDLAGKDPAAIILERPAAQTRRDPLALENQNEVATFCKWSGAERKALSNMLADLEAKGYTLGTSLATDNYAQIYVEHPDCGERWQVYWEAFRGKEYGEYVEHNEIHATFDDLALTERDLLLLKDLDGSNIDRNSGWSVSVLADRPVLPSFRVLVEETGPIALAAAERARQTPPAPAKAKQTPTPLPADQVLTSDVRDPGPGGFGHTGSPLLTTPRPPGFDQAVRERDESEKQRQHEALAALDGLSEEQLAAALTPEQLQALQQHRNERSTA